MRIQAYNSRERLPGQSPGVAPSPQVAGMIGGAAADLGKTVADVTMAYWEAQRRADRVADYHSATTSMHQALTDLNQELQEDPDESTYQQKFEERFNEARDSALEGIQDDETRQAISASFDDMYVEGSGNIQRMTWVRKAQKGKAKLLNDLDYWKNAGDLERVKTIIGDGQAAMLLDPVEAEELGKRSEREIWIARARKDIDINPSKFVKSHYPLPDDVLRDLSREAEIESNRRQAEAERARAKVMQENQSRALDMFFDGTLTPAYLKKLHKARSLDDQSFEHFMNALTKQGGLPAQETDLVTYADLKTKASQGTLTQAEVLRNLPKLTDADAKDLLRDSLKKVEEKDTALEQEKKSWREYVRATLIPENFKEMGESEQLDAVRVLVAYDRGVKEKKEGEVEQFARDLVAPAKQGLISRALHTFGEWMLPTPGIAKPGMIPPKAKGVDLSGSKIKKVKGVPDEHVSDIKEFLKSNNQAVTAANIKAVYDRAQQGGR